MKYTFLLFLTLCSLSIIQTRAIYEDISSVLNLKGKNFDKQIIMTRENQISMVHFYKYGDKKSRYMNNTYNEFAIKMNQIFRIAAIDCGTFDSICQKEGITEFPTFKVYPLLPQPAYEYKYEGEFDPQKAKLNMAGLLPTDKIMAITYLNVDSFLKDNPTKAKVLYITEGTKGIPFYLRALSHSFSGKLYFGLARKDDTKLMRKFKVNRFPKIFVFRDKTRPEIYKGKYEYIPMFDYLNIFQETFVFGDVRDQQRDEEHTVADTVSKTWNSEFFPELKKESANDICLKADFLCVIFLNPTARPSEEKMTVFQQLSTKYDSKSRFKFMWLNSQVEKQFANIFGRDESEEGIVILNPSKRKRFTTHRGDINFQEITKTLQKIEGGDARFNNIKGGKLPEFANRKVKTDL